MLLELVWFGGLVTIHSYAVRWKDVKNSEKKEHTQKMNSILFNSLSLTVLLCVRSRKEHPTILNNQPTDRKQQNRVVCWLGEKIHITIRRRQSGLNFVSFVAKILRFTCEWGFLVANICLNLEKRKCLLSLSFSGLGSDQMLFFCPVQY